MRKIEHNEFYKGLATDPKNRETAEFIRQSVFDVGHGAGYPSRAELDRHQLTEANYLILSGGLRVLPGGAGNPLAEDIMLHDFDYLDDRGLSNFKFRFVYGIHGSAIMTSDGFFPSTRFHEEQRYLIPGGLMSGYPYSAIARGHAHSSCGLSEGSSHKLRRNLHSSISKMREDLWDLPIQHTMVEALVGSRKLSTPERHSFDDSNAIAFHINNKAGLNREDVVPPTNDELVDYQAFNDQLRAWMDDGEIILGVGCLDRRMGLTVPHKSLGQIDVQGIREMLHTQKSGWSKFWDQDPAYPSSRPSAMNSIMRHTELPFGAVLTDQQDVNLMALAVGLIRTQSAMMVGRRDISDARPALVGIPYDLLLKGEHTGALARQFKGLISNLLREVWQNNRPFGLPMGFGEATRSFVEMDGEVAEVTYPDGLHLRYPRSKAGEILEGLEAGHGSSFWLGPVVHPNPNLPLYPWSMQKIGERLVL